MANWIGPAIEGKPGIIRDGRCIRPEAWQFYKLLGEVCEGKLVFPFPDRLRALPDSVFETDDMYRQHAFFSMEEHVRFGGRRTLRGVDQNGKDVFTNWIGSKARGLPDDGFPGVKLPDGHFSRPEHLETFKYVGSIGPNDLQFEINQGFTFLDIDQYHIPGGEPLIERPLRHASPNRPRSTKKRRDPSGPEKP